MFDIDTIFTRRQHQLQDQAEIDKTLSCLPCHQTVVRYLLYQREINRQQCQLVKNTHFWKYYYQVSKNLDAIDEEHITFNSYIKAYNSNKMEINPIMTCQELKEHLDVHERLANQDSIKKT